MLRSIFFMLVVLFVPTALAADLSPVSDLERLFDGGSYARFLKLAKPLARKENADALFLLGKAYQSGKGVEKNTALARGYYQRAAEKNHARAIHNLGVIAMNDDRVPDEAIGYFERALALGLTVPTQQSLAFAHKAVCVSGYAAQSCTAAGDLFVRLWEQDQKQTTLLDEGITAYATLCLIERESGGGKFPAPSCQSATTLAEQGAALGLARAAYNRGALEYDLKHYADALPWFRLADQRGEGLAAFTLGNMYERGEGVPKSDEEKLVWFKRGAQLKNPQATKMMVDYWTHERDTAADIAGIKAATAELIKLENKNYIPLKAAGRIKTMETLAAHATSLPAVAGMPINPSFCQLTRDQHGAQWWIVALAVEATYEDESTRLASGVVDDKGCVNVSADGMSAVRKALALGKTPVLHWPGQGRLLSLVPGPGGKLNFFAEPRQYAE